MVDAEAVALVAVDVVVINNNYGEHGGYNFNNGNSYNNWGQNPFQQQQENYYQNPTNNFLQQVTQQQSYSNINKKWSE